jgi:hypothetical protein
VRELPLIHVPSDLELAAGHAYIAEEAIGLNDGPAATKRESEIGNPWRAVGISRARMLPPRSC